MFLRALAIVLVATAGSAQAAEVFGQSGSSRLGRLDFVFVGASMTDNQGLANGVNCLKASASTTVRSSTLPLAPRLISATLFLGGSLIDDGEDYPGVVIFHSELTADVSPRSVSEAALAATPKSVSFRPPGATAPITVTSDSVRGPYTSVLYKPSGPEAGNLALFLTPIDVTDVMLNQGGGVLAGDYEVSGLLADVCYGAEVVCSDAPGTKTCATNTGSHIHTNGAASFALLLIFEDASLPQRSITLYEGLQDIAGRYVTERLQLDRPISSPASGSLAVYGLEGDLLLPANPTAAGPCLADEYIEVDGDTDPENAGLCLVDDDNPQGNLFNGTINLDPRTADGLLCPTEATHDYQCCYGDGLCGVVGVDIDRFNIAPALVPGVSTVRTTMHSGSDEFYVGALVLGIDVFEPTLAANTQIRILEGDEDGNIQLGGWATYSIAVSNTGNVPATSVHVTLDVPANVSDFSLQMLPSGAQDLSAASGGRNGTGRVDVLGFDVGAGKVAEIRFAVRIGCDIGTLLNATASVSSLELATFSVAASQLTTRGPPVAGSVCPTVDADGPFALREDLTRVLRGGGGGCQAIRGETSLLWMALCSLLVFVFRRARGRLLVVFLLMVSTSCSRRHTKTQPTNPNHPITSLDGLPGDPCGTSLMVIVTRADGTRFCIDRFEASLDGGALGNAHQGDTDQSITNADDQVLTTDGSTTAVAQVGLGLDPARNLSWYQASAACENAGKRLCSTADWELACRGSSGLTYPYGNEASETLCNGFFAYSSAERLMPTGSYGFCVSTCGAYDLSGNVEEWTATVAERVPSSGLFVDRAVRGGGFNANAGALACAGPEYHAAPSSVAPDRGFRCCDDAP